MTTSYNKSVFESIKNSLNKNATEGLWNKVLKFEVGKTYTLRFIPDIKHGNSIYTYQQHGWNDPETGKYTSVLSRKTFGKDEVDPIGSLCYRVKKGGKFTPEEEAFASIVKWNEYSLANVYVVDDPSNPENNGSVKIFKFGRKLAKQIFASINGEDKQMIPSVSEEEEVAYGERIFDLTGNGVNFKLKVEKQGTYQSFDGSRFTGPVNLKLTKEEIETIHDSVYDLTTLNKEYSREEIQEIVDKNTKPKGLQFDAEIEEQASLAYVDEDEDEDEVESEPVKAVTKTVTKSAPSKHNPLDDDDIESLLAD
jgi:gp32 DNA binding protein like